MVPCSHEIPDTQVLETQAYTDSQVMAEHGLENKKDDGDLAKKKHDGTDAQPRDEAQVVWRKGMKLSRLSAKVPSSSTSLRSLRPRFARVASAG